MDAQKIIDMQIRLAQECITAGCNKLAQVHVQEAFDTIYHNFETIKDWRTQVDGMMTLWFFVTTPDERANTPHTKTTTSLDAARMVTT